MSDNGEGSGETPKPWSRPEVPKPGSDAGGAASRADEFAAMRRAVAEQYADALGKRYEPPSEDEPERPRFEKSEIDPRKISEYVLNAEHPQGQHKFRVINSATGLTPKDTAQIAEQIRAGASQGQPVAGKADQYGQRWNVDVPLRGPNGSITVRTAWIVEPGSDQPRLTTVSFPPRARPATEERQ